MRIKNPIPKIERDQRKEQDAILKALRKKAKLTQEDIDKEK